MVRFLLSGEEATAMVADWFIHGFEVPGWRREAVHDPKYAAFR